MSDDQITYRVEVPEETKSQFLLHCQRLGVEPARQPREYGSEEELIADGGTDRHPIKFAQKNLDRLQRTSGLTARLNDEWEHIEAGDTLEICDDEGKPAATAEVSRVEVKSVYDAVGALNASPNHRSYNSVAAFRDALADYYPDRDVSKQTTLRLIYFEIDTSGVDIEWAEQRALELIDSASDDPQPWVDGQTAGVALLARILTNPEAYERDIETDGGAVLIDAEREIVRTLKQEGRAGLAQLCADGGAQCYSETLAAVGVLESEGVIEQVDGLRPRWRLVGGRDE